jgi:serine phosphatase RsbU (regulator of sigma subunit)
LDFANWRERVERELDALAPDDDDDAIAAALARAYSATSAEVTGHDPAVPRKACAVVIRGDPPTVALLHFRRKRAVPSALAQQAAAVAVRGWRARNEKQVVEQQVADEAVIVADLQAELRDVVDVAAGERRTREWLERSLLPDVLLPMPGLELSSRYLPGASTTEFAGGDFYDAIRSQDSVSLIIGDVQGKGMEAATLTALARHTLRSGALRGQRPADLLRELNAALLYGQAEQRASGSDAMPRFVTAATAQLRPCNGNGGFEVVIARAGHPPPVVVRSNGDIELIEPKGVLLGVADDPDFEETHLELHLADTLLLYTDGVTEHRDPSAAAFDERQLGLLVRNRRDTARAESIAQLVLDTVLLLAPAAARDDIAVLVASVTGASRPGSAS